MADGVGTLLRHWRTVRALSQEEMAHRAGISTRHLSCVENARANPSREMIMVLAAVLDLPFRERNQLLQAAGFAALYRETAFAAPEMKPVRQAVELILRQNEPFGACAVDRRYDLLMANRGYAGGLALFSGGTILLEPYVLTQPPRFNLLRYLFEPGGMRKSLRNFPDVARVILARLRRELTWDHDPMKEDLLRTALSYPGVPQDAAAVEEAGLLVPLQLSHDGLSANLYSTVTTLGTAQDITLQELRIESFHPADAESERVVRSLFGEP
jgi:transcriptional regulator with XRE-family HTH domain